MMQVLKKILGAIFLIFALIGLKSAINVVRQGVPGGESEAFQSGYYIGSFLVPAVLLILGIALLKSRSK